MSPKLFSLENLNFKDIDKLQLFPIQNNTSVAHLFYKHNREKERQNTSTSIKYFIVFPVASLLPSPPCLYQSSVAQWHTNNTKAESLVYCRQRYENSGEASPTFTCSMLAFQMFLFGYKITNYKLILHARSAAYTPGCMQRTLWVSDLSQNVTALSQDHSLKRLCHGACKALWEYNDFHAGKKVTERALYLNRRFDCFALY